MQMFLHCELLVRMNRVRDICKTVLGSNRGTFNIMTGDPNHSGGRTQYPGDRPKRGRLTRAVCTHQANDLSAANTERQIPNCGEFTVLFAEVLHFNNWSVVFFHCNKDKSWPQKSRLQARIRRRLQDARIAPTCIDPLSYDYMTQCQLGRQVRKSQLQFGNIPKSSLIRTPRTTCGFSIFELIIVFGAG